MVQSGDTDLSAPGPNGGNSIAVIAWHLSGNLASCFTDFLTSDGEKPWRQPEEEFAASAVTRDGLLEKLERGWTVLLSTLAALSDIHLQQAVTIRGRSLQAHDALHRSLAHTSYHVGQIVYVARAIRGETWRSLSIPPGGSAAYNENPAFDRPSEHFAGLKLDLDKK